MVRFIAATLLPLAVPAIITMAIWVLPGDPAEIICPPQLCTGTEALAERWNLHLGPWHFYSSWLTAALIDVQGDEFFEPVRASETGSSWMVVPVIPAPVWNEAETADIACRDIASQVERLTAPGLQ